MALETLDSVMVRTEDWTIVHVDTAPKLEWDSERREMTPKTKDGIPQWEVHCFVTQPGLDGKGLAKFTLTSHAVPALPEYERVRFVDDKIVVHHWGTQSGNRVKSGFWWEINGIEAISKSKSAGKETVNA